MSLRFRVAYAVMVLSAAITVVADLIFLHSSGPASLDPSIICAGLPFYALALLIRGNAVRQLRTNLRRKAGSGYGQIPRGINLSLLTVIAAANVVALDFPTKIHWAFVVGAIGWALLILSQTVDRNLYAKRRRECQKAYGSS